MIFLLAAAALVVGAPLVAAILVSVASHREDSAHSFAGRPPGPLAAAARRLICGASGPRRRARPGPSGARASVLNNARVPPSRRAADDIPGRGRLSPRPLRPLSLQPPSGDRQSDRQSDRTLTLPRS